MSEDVADDRQIDARFEKSHGGAVANAVRVQPFLSEIWNILVSILNALGEDVPDTEAGQRIIPMIQKDLGSRLQVQTSLPAEAAQDCGCLRP